MEALPPLARVLRYGDVRKTDTSIVAHVVDGLVARICIGLPGACSSLNDDAAAQMYEQLNQMNSAISLLQKKEHLASWQQVLIQLADKEEDLHNLLAGRSCRLLLDAGIFAAQEAVRRRTIIPETRIGYGRKRSSLRGIILCIDQSGSMGTSVVYKDTVLFFCLANINPR